MSVASRAIREPTQRTLLLLWIVLATMLACGHAAAQSAVRILPISFRQHLAHKRPRRVNHLLPGLPTHAWR